MKDVSFSWNEMLFSIQRITNLELLRTLMLCLVQLSKLRECKATDAEKLLSQWEKVAKCNLRVMLLHGHGCWKASFSVS